MRISNLENKNKHRETISISVVTVIVLAIMVSMTITPDDAKATIETCPDNWTFLLDGLNPDYFDCRNDTETSQFPVDDAAPSTSKLHSKYLLK